MADFLQIIDRFGRRKLTEIGSVKGINAEKLAGETATNYKKAGVNLDPHIDYAYRVQGDLVLKSIDYSLYVMDGSGTITLTLPTTVTRGTEITFINPTKGTFIISGNGIKIVKSGVEYSSISLTEYQSIKLKYLDVGTIHPSLWYELITIPVGVGGYVHPAAHPPSIITQDTENRFVSDVQITSFLASHSWKCGIATKNITDVSGVQTIAHGLGRVPKFVRVDGAVIITTAITQMCTGVYDGSANNGLSVCIGEGTSTAATDAVYTSTSIALGFSPLVATNPFTGANRQTGIITVDATNIYITWTKTGTVASLVASLLWQVN